jgi:ribokinase
MATAMIGAVADDDFGRSLVANLQRKNVDHRFVRRDASQSTGMSVAIFDAEGDYGAVIVSGSNLTLGDPDVKAAQDLLKRTTILVLQNEVPDAANVAAAKAAKAAGSLVLLNAAPARPMSDDLQDSVDLIVVNAIEAEMLTGTAVVETLGGALAAAKLLARTYPQVVVTAGGAGVAYADKDGHEVAIDALKVNVESTHGAGDEFIGVLAAQIASGATLDAALRNANLAAARLVAMPEKDRE